MPRRRGGRGGGGGSPPTPPAAPLSSPLNRAVGLDFGFGWVIIDFIITAILALLVAACIPGVWAAVLPAEYVPNAFYFAWGMWYPAAILVVFIAILPFYARRSMEAYENSKPGQHAKSVILFVGATPNRLRLRIKGKKYIDFAGEIPRGRTFFGATAEGRARDLTMDDYDFWELVEIAGAKAPVAHERHKLMWVRLLAWYCSLVTPVRLIGFRWAFDVLEYKLEKFSLVTEKSPEGGGPKLVIRDVDQDKMISDHVRTAPFRWPVPIADAETKSRIAASIGAVLNLLNVNPMRALRNQENWSQFANSAVVDVVIRALRGMQESNLFELNAAGTSLEVRDALVMAIRTIGVRLEQVIGMRIDDSTAADNPAYSGGVQLIAIDPVLTPKEREAFTRPWTAEREAAAERTLGDAEAYRESRVVTEVAAAVRDHGDAGMLVQRYQAMENAAATGRASLVFDTGGGSTPGAGSDRTEKILAAILAELQQRPQGGGNP